MVNKQAQLDIILKTNPMRDDYHKGIRSVDDIHTYDEVVNNEGAYGWPDWNIEDGIKALHNGYITIYSSKPIKNGIFVTPAFSQANEYAGNSWWGDKITTIRKSNNMVYQKTVPLTDVAWIDASEGQYAKTGNKKVFLTEEQISFLKQQLNESRADKLAIRYLKSKGINDYNKQMNIIGSLKHDIPNLRLDKGKYMLGALRMYYDDSVLNDEENIRALDNVLKYIHAGNHQNEYDENLNGLSLNELSNTFREISRQMSVNDRERSAQRQFNGDSEYKIIPINSYEEAAPYGKYTSWCVTHGDNAFESYTKGGNRFYFCLKNGFENIPMQAGNNAPLDEYGLSMIAVNVDMNGDLTRITTRWNHEYNGENNPGLETTEQLENIIGVRFYDIFKPYTRDELHQMGIIPFDEIPELLAQGKNPEEIFTYISSFYEGFAVVKINGKSNFISTNSKLLSPNQWFDDVEEFENGFACIELNDKHNFITTNGEILSPNQWFDYISYFENDFAHVELNNKHNLINTNGEIQFPNQWFDYIGVFYKGFARVELNNKHNFINTNGEIVFPNQWFDYASDFYNGFAMVRLNHKCNYINTNGEILSPNQWFDDAYSFYNGFGKVKLNGKYNFINTNGELVFPNQWFNDADSFYNGFAKVKLNLKWYLINTNGELFDEETKQPIGRINENINSSLSNVIQSFEPKKVLNPKIWEDGTLKKRARLKLLDIADDFIDTLNIKWVKPKDIILTGSIVNYNWSKYSDFDLHILIDFKKVDKRIDFVKEYFDSKKTIWNQQHDGLKIYGFPVELYVQDINEEHTASGIYSLYKDKWIKEPSEDIFTNIKLDKETIKNKTIKYMDIIDNLSKKVKNSKDSHKDEVLSKKIKKTFNEIKRIRKEALKNGNEMSIGNLMFKALRRLGYIEKLINLRNLVYDKLHTLNENIDNLSNDTIYYHGGYFSELHDRDELTWFTSNKDYANDYGETIGAYKIKLNNPVNIGEIDIWLPENVQKRLHEIANAIGCDFEELNDILKNISSFEDEAVYSVTRSEEFMDILIAYGYDGVIATETGNPTIGVVSVSKSVKEINNINESKQVLNESMSNIIYHYTTLSKLYKILMDDRFMLASSFEKRSDNYSNKFYYLSTTRVKDSEQGYSRGYEVRITLDGDKLNQRYSGKAINYWGDSMGKNAYMNGTATDGAKYIPYRQGRTENEDRLFSNEPFIPNARKYILRIDILENSRVKENKKSQIFLYNISNLPNVYVYEDEQAFRFQLNKGIINKDELDKRNIDSNGFSYWEIANSRDFKSDIRKDGIEVSNIFQIVLFKAKGLKREERLRLINQYAKRYGLEEYIPTIIRRWGYGASIYDIEGYLRQLRDVMESNPKTYSILCKMLNDFYVENNLKNFNDLINYLEKR